MACAKAGAVARPNFIGFWRRRLHRLYPPYFAALVLTVGALYCLYSFVGHPSAPGIAAHFGYPSDAQLAIDLVLLVLLLQNVNGASGRIGNGPFWTLALEEQLYLLYFPMLALRRRGWGCTLVVAGIVTALWRGIGIFWLTHLPTWLVLGPSRWFEWVLGALAVEAHLGRVRLPRWCSSPWAAAALGTVAVVLNTPVVRPAPLALLFAEVSMGLTFFVLINFVCRVGWGESAHPGWIVRILSTVGLFSYSLYLTHEVVIVAVKQFAMRLGFGVPVITALRIAVPIACAYAFYAFIERRFINSSRAAAKARVSTDILGTMPTSGSRDAATG
jgi:peptidoglycan/LPS O-acetylase OafA/YrhL